jgi:hypothetical protein
LGIIAPRSADAAINQATISGVVLTVFQLYQILALGNAKALAC